MKSAQSTSRFHRVLIPVHPKVLCGFTAHWNRQYDPWRIYCTNTTIIVSSSQKNICDGKPAHEFIKKYVCMLCMFCCISLFRRRVGHRWHTETVRFDLNVWNPDKVHLVSIIYLRTLVGEEILVRFHQYETFWNCQSEPLAHNAFTDTLIIASSRQKYMRRFKPEPAHALHDVIHQKSKQRHLCGI